MDKRRLMHQLETPFSTVEWPQISQENQDTILELLCSFLAPLGEYRRRYSDKPRGKRARKRKAEEDISNASIDPSIPQPDIAAHVDVGLACVSRALQVFQEKPRSTGENAHTQAPFQASYAVIFVARSGQPSAFHAHFPQMVAIATQARHTLEPTRLVGFSKACEEKLSKCIGLPRVSTVAIRSDAPNVKGLLDFVRSHVRPIEIAWLDQGKEAKFLETKINAVHTSIGPKKQRSRARLP